MSHPTTTTHKAPAESQNFALSPLAAAISFALTASAVPMISQAQEAAAPAKQTEPRQLSKLVAKDTEEEIKVDAVASPKFTQPLLDTPQTITVVTKEILRQQGAATLVEALANTPGITMQLGENGNTSAGDVFSIRGSGSQTNIFIDGIRDLGAISRDIFNTEQVEIAKGAVGADYGRGTTAGYINLVSKVPQADDFGAASLTANTGVTVRATSDINKEISNNIAVRFNAMWQDGDVVSRDFVEQNRWGFAPSIAFGLNTSTRFYLYSQHVRADNVPDGGIPSIGLSGFFNTNLQGISAPEVDRDNFYGRYDDFEETHADMGTLRVEHDFSDTFKLVNGTRLGRSKMERVLTGINALVVGDLVPQPAPAPDLFVLRDPSNWQVVRSRQSTVQENKVLTNQTNVTLSFNTGFVKHDLTSGIELIKEEQYSPTYVGLGTLPNANLYYPNAYDAYTTTGQYARAPSGAFSDGETQTYAGYAFDTLSFGEQWLFTAGIRYERYETEFESFNATTLARLNLEKSGNLASWKTGLVFKPVPFGSLYVSYSNSKTPPGNDNFTLNADPANINSPNADPAEATNTEIGTKWDLLDARLALNAAVYRTENKNQLVALDQALGQYVQYGNRRVQGAEFGVVGKLTDNWSLIGGLAWSDNEQISGSTGTNAAGSTARWAPDYSANLWTTYTTSKWGVGLGANYVDEQKRVTDPAATGPQNVPAIPEYTVFNGMVSYNVNDSLGLQLNVYNLANRDYISSLNNSGARLRLGVERYAQLTANFKF